MSTYVQKVITSADVISAELKQLRDTLGLAAASGGKSHRSLTPITLQISNMVASHDATQDVRTVNAMQFLV